MTLILVASIIIFGLVIITTGYIRTKQEITNKNTTKQSEQIVILQDQLKQSLEKQTEINNSLMQYKLAVEHAYDFIVITDNNGIVLYANPAVERVTGYTPDEAIGAKAGVLWGKQMDQKFYTKLWQIIKTEKKEFIGNVQNKRKNGEKYLASTTISPVLESNGSVAFYVAIERDLSKETKLDFIKNEFLSYTAHQLRTPATNIRWQTQLLLDGTVGEMSDSQRDIVNKIHQSSDNLNDLMRNFLFVNNIDSGQFILSCSEIKIKDLIIDIINQDLKILATTKNIKIETNFSNADAAVCVDSSILKEVLLNLISNAIKYSSDNSRVDISTQYIENNDVQINIHDFGIGIPLSEQAHLFSKFFRASNAKKMLTEGTGLGLYLCQRICEITGSQIQYTSQENHGTTFTLILPKNGWKKSQIT